MERGGKGGPGFRQSVTNEVESSIPYLENVPFLTLTLRKTEHANVARVK